MKTDQVKGNLFVSHISYEYVAHNKFEDEVSETFAGIWDGCLTDNPQLFFESIKDWVEDIHAKHSRCKELTVEIATMKTEYIIRIGRPLITMDLVPIHKMALYSFNDNPLGNAIVPYLKID